MAVCYTRPGIAHHLLYLIPHIRLIAVYPAIGTGRLLLPEGTSLQALAGIFLQFPALSA